MVLLWRRCELIRIGDRDEEDEGVVWIDASCKRLIIGGGSRWWISGEDELVIVVVVVCGGGLGVFWYWSLTKLITTLWLDAEERVLVVCEPRSSSSRRIVVFVIV